MEKRRRCALKSTVRSLQSFSRSKRLVYVPILLTQSFSNIKYSVAISFVFFEENILSIKIKYKKSTLVILLPNLHPAFSIFSIDKKYEEDNEAIKMEMLQMRDSCS